MSCLWQVWIIIPALVVRKTKILEKLLSLVVWTATIRKLSLSWHADSTDSLDSLHLSLPVIVLVCPSELTFFYFINYSNFLTPLICWVFFLMLLYTHTHVYTYILPMPTPTHTDMHNPTYRYATPIYIHTCIDMLTPIYIYDIAPIYSRSRKIKTDEWKKNIYHKIN